MQYEFEEFLHRHNRFSGRPRGMALYQKANSYATIPTEVLPAPFRNHKVPTRPMDNNLIPRPTQKQRTKYRSLPPIIRHLHVNKNDNKS